LGSPGERAGGSVDRPDDDGLRRDVGVDRRDRVVFAHAPAGRAVDAESALNLDADEAVVAEFLSENEGDLSRQPWDARVAGRGGGVHAQRSQTECPFERTGCDVDDAAGNGAARRRDAGQSSVSVGRSGREAKVLAWQWALANRIGNGSLPSGKDIGREHGRHERWGRLVKRAGLAGVLDTHT
jgi:hypothetical protein